MLLALVGVSGIGKSYFKEKIVEKLEFKKVNTIRTRQMRQNEKNGQVGIFLTNDELKTLEDQGKIAYKFDVFGSTYAYLREEIFSKENMIFEMHYTTVKDWKKIRPDIKTIYLLPNDIEIPKSKMKERNLTEEKFKERIAEINEQYNIISTNKELQSEFDYIVYNNYDMISENNVIKLVKEIMG